MKKKILVFEHNETLGLSLLEQLIKNKGFEIILVNSLKDVQLHIKKTSFDLLILGENVKAYSISSFLKFIKETQITNKILFMKDYGSEEVSFTENSTDKYHIIEKPFKIQYFFRKIDFVLAKLSDLNNVSHVVGPFVFFPKKRVIKLKDDTEIELTEKEVGILKCLLTADEEIVDRDNLLKQVWNYNPGVSTHTLDTHIYRLRQKLEKDSSIPRLIISEAGGFKINQF